MFSEIGAGDSGKEGIEEDQEQRQKDTYFLLCETRLSEGMC